jgi:5'(3')-deoxyribonucleotidase
MADAVASGPAPVPAPAPAPAAGAPSSPATSTFALLPRPVVAVDIDEVLNQMLAALCAHVNEHHATAWAAEDMFSYHFADVWKTSAEETAARVEAFLSSPSFAGLAPLAGAGDTLRRHLERFDFVVVTSRNSEIADQTRAWLELHYPGIFSRVHFGNAYGKEGSVRQSKGDMCRSLGAIALIDDNIHYIREAAPSVGTAILFGDYRWNRLSVEEEEALPPNVVRAVSWRHLDGLLGRLHEAVEKTRARVAREAQAGSARTEAASLSAAAAAAAAAASATTTTTPGTAHGMPRLLAHPSVGLTRTRATAETATLYVRRLLELRPRVTVTGTGEDTELVLVVAHSLRERGEATVEAMRTGSWSPAAGEGVDGSGAGARVLASVQVPQLTIVLRRAPALLAGVAEEGTT